MQSRHYKAFPITGTTAVGLVIHGGQNRSSAHHTVLEELAVTEAVNGLLVTLPAGIVVTSCVLMIKESGDQAISMLTQQVITDGVEVTFRNPSGRSEGAG